MLPKAKITK